MGRGAGESLQVGDQVREVVVGRVGLEAELVLEGNGEGDDEIGAGPVCVSPCLSLNPSPSSSRKGQTFLFGWSPGGGRAVTLCDLHRVQQVQLDLLRVRLGLARVYPEDAPHVLRREYHLCPVPSALGIPLVGGGAAEGETEADDEAGNGEEDRVDADCH